MFELHTIVAIFLLYMMFLFIVAYYIEKKDYTFRSSFAPYIYSLSLAIFCTAWTYYGSVGKVASSGIIFLAVYMGPTLIIFLWPIILKRLIRIKELYKVTSLADLVSVRYDKSMIIGAIVSFGALVGIIPYISIQLKAIIQSIDILIADDYSQVIETSAQVDGVVGLIIVALMSFFTIIFGLRKLDPSERHFGMIVIVAIESIIKLIALLIIGVFISYFIYPDISAILEEASKENMLQVIGQGEYSTDYSSWISIIILSMFAVMFLPRQFHVSVVENSNIKHIKTAMWVFPLYLLLITFFTIPIALGGELISQEHSLRDFYVLTIPLDMNQPLLSLIAFIGGFSASTSMIMITAMAMSIMVSNYFVLPLIESFSALHFLKRKLLAVRWVIVTTIIFLGYVFYLYVAKTNLIVNIGLISFTAILQFAPVILAGLFWEKANKAGAITALVSGFVIWFYTLIIPQFERSAWISSYVLENGLFGIELLKPTALFGMEGFASIPHAVFWTMLFNISSLVIVSLMTKSTELEKKVSEDFLNILEKKNKDNYNIDLEESIFVNEKLVLFENILNQYLKKEKTIKTINEIKTKFNLDNRSKINILELSKIYSYIERVLSGTLGTAGSYNVLKKSNVFSDEESTSLSDVYAKILKNMKISPEEFTQKINYFKEKEKLLNEHYEQLKEKVAQRDEEIDARRKAEDEVRALNETLEVKVEDRTKQLQQSNSDLEKSMDELKRTQQNLIESEKMASLGELVAGVAHEINTPVGLSLTGITHFMSMSESLAKDYEKGELSEEEFEEFINTTKELSHSINLNLNKTAQLVKSFKQVAVDQSSDETREFELREYIDEILMSLNNITKKTKIKINIDCPKMILNGYPGAISQVFTNLIINSLKHGYTKDDESSIDINIKSEDNRVFVVFKDYGKGIPSDNMPKIFNPFFTTKRDHGGSGLGLSIIYNLITTKLNGKISVHSEENVGTTFEIEFDKDINKP